MFQHRYCVYFLYFFFFHVQELELEIEALIKPYLNVPDLPKGIIVFNIISLGRN